MEECEDTVEMHCLTKSPAIAWRNAKIQLKCIASQKARPHPKDGAGLHQGRIGGCLLMNNQSRAWGDYHLAAGHSAQTLDRTNAAVAAHYLPRALG